MNGGYQNRRRLPLGAELLEGRQLLNAHIPAAVHAAADHATVHALNASSHESHEITGTLTGLAPYTSAPNGLSGTDSYTTSSKSKSGTATLIGTDAFVSTLKNAKTYNDIYYDGNLTLTLADGTTVAISYVGSGTSPTVNGPYSFTAKGEGIVTSGSLLGHLYSFTASETGNEANNSIKIKLTLK